MRRPFVQCRQHPPDALVAQPRQPVRELFGATRSVKIERRHFVFRYRSAGHFVDVFRRFYGPTFKAFSALDAAGQERLAADVEELARAANRSKSSLVVPAEYLEVVIER